MHQQRPIRALAIVVAGISLTAGAASTDAQTIYIDFGSQNRTTGGNWNNMVMTTDNTHGPDITGPNGLIDSNGNYTGFTATVTDGFAFENTAGVSTLDPAMPAYPHEAFSDSWYVNATTDNGVAYDPAGQITFGNLSSNLTYNFGFFASRGEVGDSRPTDYTIGGSVATLDAANNDDEMVWIMNVSPDVNGDIVLDVTKNTASAHFGYIGLVEIQAVPEPASLSLLGLGGLALLRRRRHA